MTKHVDGTVLPYLDASSILASSTKASQILRGFFRLRLFGSESNISHGSATLNYIKKPLRSLQEAFYWDIDLPCEIGFQLRHHLGSLA